MTMTMMMTMTMTNLGHLSFCVLKGKSSQKKGGYDLVKLSVKGGGGIFFSPITIKTHLIFFSLFDNKGKHLAE